MELKTSYIPPQTSQRSYTDNGWLQNFKLVAFLQG